MPGSCRRWGEATKLSRKPSERSKPIPFSPFASFSLGAVLVFARTVGPGD